MVKTFFRELKSIILIVVIVVAFRSSFLNWYVIPSGSMLPTLKIGDHVVVNKLSYGFMLPFMETRIFSWATPSRGDIVVFKGPAAAGDLTLIKRVVGLSGDRVSFTNGVLTLNGQIVQESLQNDRSALQNLGGNETGDGYNLYLETGSSKTPHYVMRREWGGITAGETQTWVIPAGKLLLIGDNRDNSEDGRFWGFMDEDHVYGRAFRIAYSTYDAPNVFLPKFRSDRWFSELTN